MGSEERHFAVLLGGEVVTMPYSQWCSSFCHLHEAGVASEVAPP